jgi:hypothetical protein
MFGELPVRKFLRKSDGPRKHWLPLMLLSRN